MIKTSLEDLIEKTFEALGSPIYPRKYKNEIEDKGRLDSFLLERAVEHNPKLLLFLETEEATRFEADTTPSFARRATYKGLDLDYEFFAPGRWSTSGNYCSESIRFKDGLKWLVINYGFEQRGKLDIEQIDEELGEIQIYNGIVGDKERDKIVLENIMKFIRENVRGA